MPNALLLVLTVVLVVVAAFWFGHSIGAVRRDRVWEKRMDAIRRLAVTPTVTNDEWRRDTAFIAKTLAFARAAEAVTVWPHRVDRRADLARHLESLATAPELGAPTPNPEATAAVESPSNDSQAPSAAPVLAGEDVLDPQQDDDRIIDAYRLEGFL